MSILETRGGSPHIFRDTIDTTGRSHFIKSVSKWICIRVATNPCRIYFTEDDYTNDENYIEVPIASTSTPYGQWSGPIETNEIWLKGIGGNSVVEFVAIKRLN